MGECIACILVVDGLHRHTCRLRHPPGDEVYRHEESVSRHTDARNTKSVRTFITSHTCVWLCPVSLSMFEVDGSLAPVYCQNLCYLAKLFIKSKRQDTYAHTHIQREREREE